MSLNERESPVIRRRRGKKDRRDRQAEKDRETGTDRQTERQGQRQRENVHWGLSAVLIYPRKG